MYLVNIIIKVDVAGAQMSPEDGGVGGEDGGNVGVTESGDEQSDAGIPFVEVGDDGGSLR